MTQLSRERARTRVRSIYPKGNILEITIDKSSANAAGGIYDLYPIPVNSISFVTAKVKVLNDTGKLATRKSAE